MARVQQMKVTTELKVILELNEAEVRALDGIFGYDVEQFLKVFYERMGKEYVRPHEAGVRSLHETIRKTLAEPLEVVNKAKMALKLALNQV